MATTITNIFSSIFEAHRRPTVKTSTLTANLFYFVHPSAFKSMKPLFWLKAISTFYGDMFWEMLIHVRH